MKHETSDDMQQAIACRTQRSRTSAYGARYVREVMCSLKAPPRVNLPKQVPREMSCLRAIEVARFIMSSLPESMVNLSDRKQKVLPKIEYTIPVQPEAIQTIWTINQELDIRSNAAIHNLGGMRSSSIKPTISRASQRKSVSLSR